jgi:hypothetical protein
MKDDDRLPMRNPGDGETRTRTGDTTIFRQMHEDPEWAGNPRSQAGFGGGRAQG